MYARRRSTTGATAVGTRLVHRAMVIGGTLMVLTTMATSAQAADGQFPYSRFDTGARDALFNPPNDTCLPLPGGATHAGNDTDATAFVYADSSCTQLLALVGVGGTWDATGPPVLPARSVRFGSS
jgi:hypothetical protein